MRTFVIDKRIIDMLLVYGLILTSGSLVHRAYQKQMTLLLFAVSLGILVFYVKKFDPKFLIYIIFTFILLFGIYFYTDGSLPLSSVAGTLIMLITAYIVLLAVKENFIDSYLNIMVSLAAISLIGYLTDVYSLFTGLISHLPSISNSYYEGFIYAFRFMPHIDRNNSIFFEPGVYQGFLNAALYMIFFSKTHLSSKRKIVFALVFIIALFSTFSTTGFIIFLLMLSVLLARSKILSRTTKISVAVLLLILISAFSDRVQHTVIEKISEYTEFTTLESGIQERRTFDALVDLEIFKSDILGNGYENYEAKFNRYSRYYDTSSSRNFDPRQGSLTREFGGSSNGITKILAVYGIIFSLYLFLSYYYFFHKFLSDWLMRILSFAMLLMFFNGEVFGLMPMCMTLIAAIFVFNSNEIKNTSTNI